MGPDHGTLMLWAMRTGVPLPGLEHGETPDGDPVVRREGLEPPTR